ncbi:MAG: glycine--tRNA ligase subunit beta [Acidobacteriota bacterium]
MSNRFLFELGTEEIPAGMIEAASRQLAEGIASGLEGLQVSFQSPLRRYSTPRRLAVIVEGLPESQPDRREVIAGPPLHAAYDDQGNPTRAAEGFARKVGVAVSDLEEVESDRGAYLSYARTVPGRPVTDLLPEVAEQAIRAIHWPKTMYWQESRFRFIRPLRWLVALWNDRVVEMEIEGVASGRTSWGHRFLGRQRVDLGTVEDYPALLADGCVVADPDERRRRIEEGLAAAVPEGLSVLADDRLLEDVVHLNEYPSVICGSFASDYLKIPREVLITVMRHHQKYFGVTDSKGELKPYFLTVLNSEGDQDGRIRKGHERVLKARLEDAAFFWETDRRTPLADRAAALGQILFQKKLGSYGDKARRLEALCGSLAQKWPGLDQQGLRTAARLCKADLSSGMVGELSELQGVMGGLYARHEGYPEPVWKAVYQHYQPESLEDPVPDSLPGAVLSLADKLDTLVGCFGIGLKPTGSRDPFALRRQAQGIVKILFELGDQVPVSLTLTQLVDLAQGNFKPSQPADQVRRSVVGFLERRVRFMFEQQGLAYDVLNAVLALGVAQVRQAFDRARSLSEIRGQSDFEALAAAFKRMRNILGKQAGELPAFDPGLLQDPAEKALHQAYLRTRAPVESMLQKGRFPEALKRLAKLRRPVDEFFDEVLVMAPDEALKNNRLRLLEDLSQLFLQIADISEIVQSD